MKYYHEKRLVETISLIIGHLTT